MKYEDFIQCNLVKNFIIHIPNINYVIYTNIKITDVYNMHIGGISGRAIGNNDICTRKMLFDTLFTNKLFDSTKDIIVKTYKKDEFRYQKNNSKTVNIIPLFRLYREIKWDLILYNFFIPVDGDYVIRRIIRDFLVEMSFTKWRLFT